MPDTEPNPTVELFSISVASRIAPFWRDLPKYWFSQFEAIVTSQRLAKEARFDLVISKLSKEELTLVGDLLDNDERSYDELKERLLSCLQVSAEEQFDNLLRETELGEQKPSQLFRRMTELAKSAGVEAPTVKKLWLRRLPVGVRNTLVAHEHLDMEQLTSLADRVLAVTKQGAVEEVSQVSADSEAIRSISERVERLCDEVSSIRNQQGASNSRNFASRINQQPRRSSLCIYHQRFGRFARNCQSPCAWQNRARYRAPAPSHLGGAPRSARQGN